jgi:hypothetical protein
MLPGLGLAVSLCSQICWNSRFQTHTASVRQGLIESRMIIHSVDFEQFKTVANGRLSRVSDSRREGEHAVKHFSLRCQLPCEAVSKLLLFLAVPFPPMLLLGSAAPCREDSHGWELSWRVGSRRANRDRLSAIFRGALVFGTRLAPFRDHKEWVLPN